MSKLVHFVASSFHFEPFLKRHAHIFRSRLLLGQRGHLRAQRVLREQSARLTRVGFGLSRGLRAAPNQVILQVARVRHLGQSLGEGRPRLECCVEQAARGADHVHDGSRHLLVQVQGRRRDRTLSHKLDRLLALSRGGASLVALHDQGGHKELRGSTGRLKLLFLQFEDVVGFFLRKALIC